MNELSNIDDLTKLSENIKKCKSKPTIGFTF